MRTATSSVLGKIVFGIVASAVIATFMQLDAVTWLIRLLARFVAETCGVSTS